MFRHLYYRGRYGSYLRSQHGIKKFAEMAMGQLIRKVTKKSAFYREMNENLLVEKANLRMRAEELYEQPMLNAGEFFSVRRRLWANSFIVAAVIATSIFIILLSVSTLLIGEASVSRFAHWSVSTVLAIVLTGGGLIIAERLIESILPRRRPSRDDLDDLGSSVTILWATLLIGIELAIFGITDVRGSSLAASNGSGFIHFGFVVLAMLLPIVAGAIRWDAMRYIDRYKTTRAHRDIDSRLAQIDSILRQNEEYESNFYKMKSIEYWDLLNEFRTLKDLYNEKHAMTEKIGEHFSRSYDAFQREAYKRYESDLRDLSSTSMRRLDVKASTAGAKIGQASRLHSAPSPSSAERTAPDRGPASNGAQQLREGETEIRESEIYLSPKPVR